MNITKSLAEKIFFNQETSYECPRHGDLIKELVCDNVGLIWEKGVSYEDFVGLVSESEEEVVRFYLTELDNYLVDYKYVRTESQEMDWDQDFERTLWALVDKFED